MKKKKNTGKQKKLKFIGLCMVVVVAGVTSGLFLHPGHTHDISKPHTLITNIQTSKQTGKPSDTITPPSASSTQSTALTQPTPLAIPGSGIYVAVSGNTLASIAQMFGISLGAIEALNPQISDPGLIYTGQSNSSRGNSPVANSLTAIRHSACLL